MICNFCGAFLRDGAEKCSTCGRPTAPADTADDKPFLLGRESTDYADVPPAPEPKPAPEPSAGNYQRGAALLTAHTFHRPYLAAAHGNACQRGFKAYLAAERDYLAAYIFHDRFEHVRADVRLGFRCRAAKAFASESPRPLP